MKCKVTYYDVETGHNLVKNCYDIDYNNIIGEDCFSFSPADNPDKIYNFITIDHPKVSICQNDIGIRIYIRGYQHVKSRGYIKTTTVIETIN